MHILAQKHDSYLTNLRLLPGGSAPKLVKGDIEPLIDVGMYLVVLVADLLRSQAFFQRLHALSHVDKGGFVCAYLGHRGVWWVKRGDVGVGGL